MQREKTFRAVMLAMLAVVFAVYGAIAQPPPPDHGEEDDQPASVGSGLVILLTMGVAYGTKKVYDARKKF